MRLLPAVLVLSLPFALAGAASAEPARTVAATPAPAAIDGDACVGGEVLDDGTGETGYGWVPSVRDGIYVQRFVGVPGSAVGEVCVCWLRTQADSSIDFELVVYADAGGRPAEEPLATVPARAEGVPSGIGGRFYRYRLPPPAVRLPGELVYVGVRWDPFVDRFFFVCADTSPATPQVPVYYRDEQAGGWAAAIGSHDPTFQGHRALMVRAGFVAPPLAVPALGGPGALALTVLVAALGLRRLVRR